MTTFNEVRAVFEATSRAWADGDIEQFAGHYTDEATATLPGFHLSGKTELRSNMAAAFAGPLKGSQRIHVVQKVRLLNADTAIVISRSATRYPEEEEPANWTVATWVLARHAGRWLIEAYHDSPVITDTKQN